MPENEDANRRKLDLSSELGVSRRDLLRRGAVVGGTLLWAAPLIQSIRTPAYAQSEVLHTCCLCTTKRTVFGGSHCFSDGISLSTCQTDCGGAANVVKYCTGSDGASCTGRCFGPGVSTCKCSADNGSGFVVC